MPISNPLIQQDGGIYTMSGTADVGSFDNSTSARRQPSGGGGSVSPMGNVGTGDLRSPHNLPLHLAGLIIIGLAVIFGLQLAGFRFAAAVGVGS